ncbi:MAG: PHP domain-containing protein, partial [Acidimicrobiia bacterium]|nr:PHP domain-containing protein [Acidimicrobiia bacterium]
MAVDLHTHSSISDGSDTPSELIRRASVVGLDAIALTDHDTIDGLSAAGQAADHHGIRLVPGLELSLAWDRGGMHMVVLFLDDQSGPLQDRLAWLQVARAGRNDRMIALLQSLGYDITIDEVRAEAGAGVTGRPHIAAVLVRKGYVPDIPAAFDELLA